MSNPNIQAGPGRSVGSKNLTTQIREKLKEIGCDPVLGLAQIAMNEKNPLRVRESAYTTLYKSIVPTLRSVEITGEEGGPLSTKVQIVYKKLTESPDEPAAD